VKNRYGGNWHFLTPRVVDVVLKEFDIKITRQQAESHEPNKAAGKTLAKKWGIYFMPLASAFKIRLLISIAATIDTGSILTK